MSKPRTEAGKRLMRGRSHADSDYEWYAAAVLEIEQEAAAGLLDERDVLLLVLRDVLATIERLYHPDIGWYVHPVYMAAARLVDAASQRGSGAEEAARNG